MTLTFPSDFDPFAPDITDAEVAELVRQLWTERVEQTEQQADREDPRDAAYISWCESEERQLRAARPELFAEPDWSNVPY